MKLYTENQMKSMLGRARLHKQDDTEIFTDEYLISQETPIELPSDEEIEEEFDTNDEKYYIFSEGAKWMKEQITKTNNMAQEVFEFKEENHFLGFTNPSKDIKLDIGGMAQQILRTKVETYRIDKKCEKCKEGIMYATGRGVTQWHSYWEHKCDECGHIQSYENITYPYNEYIDIKNKKK